MRVSYAQGCNWHFDQFWDEEILLFPSVATKILGGFRRDLGAQQKNVFVCVFSWFSIGISSEISLGYLNKFLDITPEISEGVRLVIISNPL